MNAGKKTASKEQLIEEILEENYKRYFHLAYGYLHNEADALDVVQEGAYKAILKCETLREDAYADTWVYRIMLNEIFRLCRERNNQFSREERNEEELSYMAESTATNFQDFAELYDAIDRLETQEKTILELRYFHEMKLTEVAQSLEINLNTAKSRLYRAMDKLRTALSGVE